MNTRQTYQTWKNVLFRPYLQTFETEKSGSKLSTALFWMAIVGFVGNFIGTILMALMLYPIMPNGIFSRFDSSGLIIFVGFIVISSIAGIILLPGLLLIGSGILFVLAKLLGGTGDFESQTYLISAFAAPIWFVSRIIAVVPIVGWFIVVGLGFYQIYLGYLTIQAIHTLDQKRSLAVVLIPVVLGLVLLCGIIFLNLIAFPGPSSNQRFG